MQDQVQAVESSGPESRTPLAWVNALRTTIDIGSKVAITIGAICYGLGLLIVSSHLSRVGVYTTDFFRTEYVLVGGAFFVLTLCAAVAAHYFLVFIRDTTVLWKQKKYRRAAVAFILTAGGSVVAFSRLLQLIATDDLGSIYNWRTWLTLIVAITAYATVRNTLQISRLEWVNNLEQKDEKTTTRHAWNLVYNLATLIAVIGVYTSFVYPHLLAQYGGGHRDAVLLIPTASGQRVAHIAQLPFQPDGSIGPVQLLLENEQALTVATMDDGRAVSIARDLIDAVAEYKPAGTTAKPADRAPTVTAPRPTTAVPVVARPKTQTSSGKKQ